MKEMLRYRAEKVKSNFEGMHPNKIEEGFTFEGLGYYPTVGESFSLVGNGRIFQTSCVLSIDKETNVIDTMNSKYKVTEVKDN